jgi:hypothetical protein
MTSASDDQITICCLPALDELRDLGRKMLTIGVESDDGVIACLDGARKGGAQRSSLSAIDVVADDDCTRLRSDSTSTIGGTIIHDQYIGNDRARL